MTGMGAGEVATGTMMMMKVSVYLRCKKPHLLYQLLAVYTRVQIASAERKWRNKLHID